MQSITSASISMPTLCHPGPIVISIKYKVNRMATKLIKHGINASQIYRLDTMCMFYQTWPYYSIHIPFPPSPMQ